MEKLIVVGSGPSAVHFTLSVLKKGYDVLMLDAGLQSPPAANPEDGFDDLKRNLADPVSYFIGKQFESVIMPDDRNEYYGFPPNKKYIFQAPGGYEIRTSGFTPLLSFAQGGLAEAWTGAVYPFNDTELNAFPFSYADLDPHYVTVAERIGVSGAKDDLSRFVPYHSKIMPPLDLDAHSKVLMERYTRHRRYINERCGAVIGRSRVATLSSDMGSRKKCDYTGRCLWGCPQGALYTPSLSLEECRRYPNFAYQPGVLVRRFKYDSNRRITLVIGEWIETRQEVEFPINTLVLGAGAISSSRIFLESMTPRREGPLRLTGLMDNRQVLVPFINLSMIGRRYDPHSYQYHLMGIGLEARRPEEFIHGLITTLKTTLGHPIFQKIPTDLKTALYIFRNVRGALGVINVNFHDYRRENNFLELEPGCDGKPRLFIHYQPRPDEPGDLHAVLKRIRKVLWRLGCVVPPGMLHVRPMGSSVHYAGTLPMSPTRAPMTVSTSCRSHDFENLYFVDGSTFPFLPSKNITFTLMANAVRIAEAAF
jgi:choline dehydrogenase-like flavoprotein